MKKLFKKVFHIHKWEYHSSEKRIRFCKKCGKYQLNNYEFVSGWEDCKKPNGLYF